LKLAHGQKQAFLFESVEPGERVGRFSFIGINPRRVFRTETGREPDPFKMLEQHVSGPRVEKPEGFPPFTGGLVGFLGYECVSRLEPRVQISNPDEHGFPESVFFDVDTVVAFDNVRRELQLIAQVHTQGLANAKRRLQSLNRCLSQSLPKSDSRKHKAPIFKPRTTPQGFMNSVAAAQEYVSAGDVQQVVLSQRFDATTTLSGFALYRALRRVNPSPFMFFVRDGNRELIGASPERLVEVRNNRVAVRPIAGTRKRGLTPEHDARHEAELLADEKEAAEHVMLVDLGRNDVGRVSRIGSVKVESLRVVEKYSHLMHLVSQVSGTLDPQKSSVDALKAAFPAGTLSGAPKVRAMEIIDELESSQRGPYGGAVGYVDTNGDLDFAIVIRTFMKNGKHLCVQAGAGVVHDSVPQFEHEETHTKAQALFVAAELAAKGSP
jgi:anthranilate synthase component I